MTNRSQRDMGWQKSWMDRMIFTWITFFFVYMVISNMYFPDDSTYLTKAVLGEVPAAQDFVFFKTSINQPMLLIGMVFVTGIAAIGAVSWAKELKLRWQRHGSK